MKSFAVLLLLGQIDARHFIESDMVQLDVEASTNLGSLEGAYLAQKQLMKQRAFKWDEGVLEVMNGNQYVASQRDALEEQQVNIEFAQAPSAVPESQPQAVLAQKPAHKSSKKAQEVASIDNSDSVERSNIAEIASKFEEESREYEAQDKNMYIEGENGQVRLRHASDGFAAVAQKQKFEEDNSAKILTQLKKEKEDTQKKLADLAEKKKQEQENKKNSKINKQVDEMKDEWTLFCQTLDTAHHDKAMEMWTALSEAGSPQQPLKAVTKQIYAQGFNFGDVASNDDVVGILADLEAAQQDYNMNPDNQAIMQNFITAAQTAAKDIEYKYKEFWTNPAEKIAMAQATKKAAEATKEE